jgi:hypothetical protein
MGATMSDQVSFHEAGFGLIPIVTGAHRDLLFDGKKYARCVRHSQQIHK